jgi:hypothetical protein
MSYHKEGRKEKDNFINPATIVWDYLMYRCYRCGSLEKYTFRDIERKVREHLSSVSDRFKEHIDSLDSINFDHMDKITSYPTLHSYKRDTTKRLERLYSKK